MSKNKFKIINVHLARSSETSYITIELSEGDEIEFTRHLYEEEGNVKEFEYEIENKEEANLFDSLDDNLQDEIVEAIESA